MHPVLLLIAQEAPTAPRPPGGAVLAGSLSVSVTVALAVLCWIGKRVWGWSWTPIVAGACLGVAGASGFVGDICRMLIGIGVNVFTSVAHGFG